MKAGAEYEQFVYEKLKRLFADGKVTLNDKITGNDSKLNREIDVSVRLTVGDTKVLYIVQCKDWATRVDINVLGALSAVMLDVGASKGFLLCTSGFYATNYHYALKKGIELITIEDIESDKWTVSIQIPLVYVRQMNQFQMTIEIKANEALVELNRDRALTLDLSMSTGIRTSCEETATTVEKYILQKVKDPVVEAVEGVSQNLTSPTMELYVFGIWVPCSHLSIILHTKKVRYLKYLTPTEYSQLRDHVRGTTLPLHFKLDNINLSLDDSFIELPESDVPVTPGLWIEVVESSVIPGKAT